MTLHGWDASDFDWDRGPMDLDAAYRDGIRFFTHKATEGTKVIHRYYGAAMDRARAAGLEFVGAYMVPRTPGNNGHGSVQDQVSFFLNYLDSQTPWWRGYAGFFLQVDSEHWGYDDVSADIGAAVCAELGRRVDKLRIHYAPAWAYGDSIGGNDPLWASSYGTNPAAPYREVYAAWGGDGHVGWSPYSGRTPTILQYGSRTIIGSQPTCDGNAFRGSIEEFRAMITGSAKPAEVPDMNVGDGVLVEKHLKSLPVGDIGVQVSVGEALAAAVRAEEKVDALAARLSGAVPVTLAPGQMAELASKLPTAADIVTELLNRVPRV